MFLRDILPRWLSPSLFAVIALCFLLPFATVSCDNARTTFTGLQLVTHTVPRGGVLDEPPDCVVDLSTCVERVASTTVTIAFAAALIGLALGLLGFARGPGWCAAVGCGALAVLPFEGPFLGPDESFHSGYKLGLVFFACAGVLHLRRAWRRTRARRRPRRALTVHVGALFVYALVIAIFAVISSVSNATAHSIGDGAVAWVMFVVVPAWLIIAAVLFRWHRQDRPELSERALRWDALLWLGPFLVLGLRSQRLRTFLVPPTNPVAPISNDSAQGSVEGSGNMFRTIFLLVSAISVLSLAALTATAGARTATPDPRLLAAYQPVTRLDPAESFGPTSVESFISDSDLERLDASGNWVIANADPEPGDLPGPGTGTWRLNQDSCSPAAPLGGLACYAAGWQSGTGASTVYGRVIRGGDRIVLQYWYFYYDDVYSYFYPPVDLLWQAHEGDWEVVNVVLSADEQPVEVGYSQHCLGQRRAWADTPRLGTHPLVYVAVGSHANYFSLGAHPLDARCVPPQVFAILARLGLPAPVDRTGLGELAGPPQAGGEVTTIHEIGDGVHAWESFPGFWGELQYFHAPSIGTVPFGASPVGPALHEVWSDPLGTLATWPSG